ncbi:hypothetical protein Q7C36_023526 [Tachysurus vachellii]|uniref:Uncharacterized protein n=1 Tax=Tachysurus vachellii TaxID=175792 RepID=A0AA88IF27_TACVA|nr:hypothetical protein Q7C36_023526 [Tachysurus vachellii]
MNAKAIRPKHIRVNLRAEWKPVKGAQLPDVTHPSLRGRRRWRLSKEGVPHAARLQINIRAKAAASHQHRWAALEHHRRHLCTFHLLTKERLPR